MARKPLPPTDLLRQLLTYDADTGEFRWNGASRWQKRGRPAGGVSESGYVVIKVAYSLYKAHRIAWALVHGECPPDSYIDHIDGNRSDNRISNLRLATSSQNARNRAKCENTKTGVLGVAFQHGRYKAHITAGSKKIHLGTFDNLQDATAAREEANHVHGYDRNHGGR